MADNPVNSMLDAIERLIEAQLAMTPEARSALVARLTRMLPEIAPVAPVPPLAWAQILAGLKAGDNRRWTETESQARQQAKGLVLARMTPARRRDAA